MAEAITGKSGLIGLMGWPVAHSLSPAMHNAAAAALGLDLVYVPLPVRPEDLAAAVRGLPALGFLGANVTVPHKETILPLLDEVEPAARAIGAVNTLVIGLHLMGHNTDWIGFLDDLAALGVGVGGRECLVLGAGGSARAVAYGLASAGGRVHVLGRRPEQARRLVKDLVPYLNASQLQAGSLNDLKAITGGIFFDLIVNTTPLGMTPHIDTSPWPAGLPFSPNTFVYDLVYNPAETQFMQQARAAGCRAANGLGMLARQGALAFELWTGIKPDPLVMEATLSNKLD